MSNFYEVENLKKSQEELNQRLEAGEQLDNGNDFVSYKMLYEGKTDEESNIASHNIDKAYAECTAASIARCIKKYAANTHTLYDPKSLILGDFGGGAGFLAASLAPLFNKVVSYDIAEYAGKYGREHFPEVTFVTQAIEPDMTFEEGPFDISLAYEFYPFTRTDEYEYGKSYLDTLLDNTKSGGFLVIGLPDGKERKNIYRNWDKIKKDYKDFQPAIIQQPYAKVSKRIKSAWLQDMMSKVLGLFKERHLLIVLRKC